MIVNTDKMWTPPDSEAVQDLQYVESNFGPKTRGGPVLFVATERVHSNLISLEAFETLWDVHEKVMSTVSGNDTKYSDICANRDNKGHCMVYGVLQYFQGNRTLYNIQVKTLQQLRQRISAPQFPDGTGVLRDQIFSNYTLTAPVPPQLPVMLSCLAMEQFYFIQKYPADRAIEWEREFFKAVEGSSNANVTVVRNTNSAYDDELAKAAAGDAPLMFVMYALFVALTFVALSKGANLLDTRIGLSVTGLLLLILANAAGFGICSGLGVPIISTHLLIPFLIACVGTVNMYLVVSAFDAQDSALPVEERLGLAMQGCHKSLLYAALSASAAFYLGGVSRFFAVRSFCYYAGTTVFVNYVLQVNVFAAALSLDARRRDGRKLDLLCCITGPYSERAVVPTDDVAVYADGKDTEEAAAVVAPVDPTVAKYLPSETATVSGEEIPVPALTVKPAVAKPSSGGEPSGLHYFFSDVYVPVISLSPVRALVFLGFCGMLVANVFLAFPMHQALDPAALLPESSPVRQFMETARPLHLFAAEQSAPAELVLPFLDYHNQTIQEKIFEMQGTFLNQTDYNKGPMVSWLTGFYKWARALPPMVRPPFNPDGYVTNEAAFYTAVRKFVNSPPGQRFLKDVKFANTYAGDITPVRIKMSRFTGFHSYMSGPVNATSTMNHARRLVQHMNFPPGLDANATRGEDFNSTLRTDAFVFSPPYIKAEGYKIAVRELFKDMIAACVGVAGVSLLVLKPYGIAPMVVATVTTAATYLYFVVNFHGWETLELNFISVSMIVMAIALMTAYMLHTIHHYHAQPFTVPPLDRLRNTLVQVGPPVLKASLTALIAVLPMAAADSYIYRVFFRTFFFVVVYSMIHALVLLPAILPTMSYLGLETYGARDGDALVKPKEVEMVKQVPVTGAEQERGDVVPFAEEP
jgi:Niemann-Pick C1 protein